MISVSQSFEQSKSKVCKDIFCKYDVGHSQKKGGKGGEIALVSAFFACGKVFHNFHVLEAVSARFETVHTSASFQMEPDKGDH